MGAVFAQEMGQSYDVPTIIKAIQTITAIPNTEHYVVEKDGSLIGVLSLLFTHDQWSNEYICQKLHWYVLPEHRGALGTKLLDLLEERARDEGCTEIRVTAFKELRGYEPTETSYRKKI